MSKRILVLLAFLLVVVFLPSVSRVHGQDGAGQAGFLQNPLNINDGADPWLTYYNGNYYLAATTWASHWTMRKSPTLAGLKTAEAVPIYFETDPSRCCNFWAPEFRLLDGADGKHWYFYYSAGTDGTLDNQHSQVLESEGTDPMGLYHFKARLADPGHENTWMIDGTLLQLNDKLYFVFSAGEGGLQSLFIAPMSNPWTISGARVKIAVPEYAWENQGGHVNEGPVMLQHDDKTFLVYSASSCATGDYKLGMLTYNGGDPLSADSWLKNPAPIFQRADANGVFGPGHNGFFKSPDGTEDWIVYHAVDFAGGACDGRRNTRVQKISWNADGTPNLGVPVAYSEVIAAPSGDLGVDPLPVFEQLPTTRIHAMSYKSGYLRHVDFGLTVDLSGGTTIDSQFVVRPGLADANGITFQSVNFPSYYIGHAGKVVKLVSNNASADFAGDVTWYLRPGLADETWQSFESFNQAGFYIGQQFGVLALVQATDNMSKRMREDATFLQEGIE